MPEFSFCPVCAGRLQVAQPPTEDRPRLVCVRCGHIFYINPKVVSGTLPVADGRVWLLRRGIEPRLGFWTHPAGYQEWGESAEEAAVRESQEEIGCDVRIRRLLGVYSHASAPVVNIVYLAGFATPNEAPRLTSEAIEVQSFAPAELPWEELAFTSTAGALRDWLALLKAESQ